MPQMDWKPIDTAPMDYGVVLLYQPAGPGTAEAVGQGHRTDLHEHAHNKWVFQATQYLAEPTHWMPLPAPPQKEHDKATLDIWRATAGWKD